MNQQELYSLADTLQMELRVVSRRITGKTIRNLYPAIPAMTFELEVMSSVCPNSGAGTLVRMAGKLGLFVACSGSGPTEMTSVLLVLDLSKLPAYGGGLFENLPKKPENMTQALVPLQKAVTASFRRLGAQPWQPLGDAK